MPGVTRRKQEAHQPADEAEAAQKAAEEAARKATEESEAEFKRYRDEVWKTVSENHDAFDKQVLTLSSAFLGFSLTFMKDIVPLSESDFLPVLYLSWGLFAASVLSTMISFLVSTQAQHTHLNYCEKVYRGNDPSYADKKNPWAVALGWINTVSGAAFFAGIALTMFFCIWNVNKEVSVNKKGPIESASPQPARVGVLKEGKQPPKIIVPQTQTNQPSSDTKK